MNRSNQDEEKNPLEVHRLKARIYLDDGTIKVVQGVREIFEIKDSAEKSSDSTSDSKLEGKMVLIGRHMEDSGLKKSLLSVITS